MVIELELESTTLTPSTRRRRVAGIDASMASRRRRYAVSTASIAGVFGIYVNMIVPKIPGSKAYAHLSFGVLVIALVSLCKGRIYDLKTALASPPGQEELGYRVELKARDPGEHVALNDKSGKRRDLEADALVMVNLVTDSERNLNLNLNLTPSLRRRRWHRSTS